MTTWRSFWKGWRMAAGLWPVVLLLYLVDSALALILIISPATQLAGVFGHSALASQLAGPYSVGWLIEAIDLGQGMSVPWPLYLLMPSLYLVVATFLRGGTLGALAKEGQGFLWTEFFSDCARCFGRFLILLLFFVPGIVVVGLLFLAANLLLGFVGFGGLAGGLFRVFLLAFLVFLLVIALDYARISLVLEPERSLLEHVGRGLHFLLRRFPQVVLLGLGFLLAAGLLAALYPVLLQFTTLSGTFLLAPLVQQIAVLLMTFQRVAALAGETTLYRGKRL